MKKESLIIELDGLTYQLTENRLSQIPHLDNVETDAVFVSDLQEAVSKNSLVESDIKYADLITRKNLQETGEFDEPASVLTHWKKKKGKNSTEICFTALPSRLLLRYQEKIALNSHAILLLPLYAVLIDVLKKRRSRNPVAVTFMHSRFVDMIIGTRKRIYYANRCVAFDTSQEQIRSLWNAVKIDIEHVEKENGIEVAEILYLDWIDSRPPENWSGESSIPFVSMKPEPVLLDGDEYSISFVKASMETSGRRGVSSFPDKAAFYAKRFNAHMNVLFLFAIMLCLALGFYAHTKRDNIQSDTMVIKQQIDKLTVPNPGIVPNKNSKDILGFVNELMVSRNSPTYKEVINHLSSAFAPFAASDIRIKEIRIDYQSDSVSVEVSGRITAPFDTAYQGFQSVVSSLRRMSYEIKSSSFDTQIRTSDFLLKLAKRV